MDKKGITLQDAIPSVLIIGAVFLIMATVSFIGYEYGGSMSASDSTSEENVTTTTVVNSSDPTVLQDPDAVCNFGGFSIQEARESISNTIIPSGNYTTYPSNGSIICASGECANESVGNQTWIVNFSFDFTGTACNVTDDLQTEVGDNTSIAGIVLTIILVGIILGVLIGVFASTKRKAF